MKKRKHLVDGVKEEYQTPGRLRAFEVQMMARSLLGDNMLTKFSPTSPHFFKIIGEETLRNNKLKIPNKFVRIYGATLSSTVVLKLPCGLRWDLGLTKCDGKVWIDKGWKEFSKYYSLGHGDLLVLFRYEGKSKFHVLIFDKSTMEIDYPSKPNRFEKHDIDKQTHELVKEETEESDSVENLEGFSPCPKAREKSPLPCPRSHKRMRTNPVDKTQSNQSRTRPKDVRRQRLTLKEKAQALERARGFKSEDPFCMVAMQPSYVGAKYALNIPYHFAKKHLGTKHAHVILKVGNGRAWSVRYSFSVHGKGKYPKGRFEGGWKAFVQDNDLRVGDVCVFVLTKSSGISLDVAIFRKNQIRNISFLPAHEASTIQMRPRESISSKLESQYTIVDKRTGTSTPSRRLTQESFNGKARALEKAIHHRSENPSFTVVMQASYATARCYFKLPAKFVRRYINKNKGDAILRVSDGRYWSVQYKVRWGLDGRQVTEFCHGWTAFAHDNSLRKGDICTFELTNGNEIEFTVFIVKAQDHLPVGNHEKATKPVKSKRNLSAKVKGGCTSNNEISMLSVNPNPKEEQEEIIDESAGKFMKQMSIENTGGQVTQSSVSRASRASRAASKFVSKNPHFQIDFPSGHLETNRMNLPLTFGRSYLGEKSQTVTLQVGERSWPVKLLVYRSLYKLSSGWSAFVRENFLRPRDVLMFELIERQHIVLKVSIFKQAV